jgi:DNA-binding NtrC family response regulator
MSDERVTEAEARVRAPRVAGGRFALVVIEGPDLGSSVVIEPGQPSPLLVGSGPACHLRLADPLVSRRHLSIDVQGRAIHALDLRSTNGVLVNGVAILEALLHGGEILRLGATKLRLDLVSQSESVTLPSATSFGRVLGSSVAMRRLYGLCERLSESSLSVLIEGETGTGKELLAEALHENGPRARGPFVVFDCTSVPPSLVESDLFGHEKGAFTGAVEARKGVFEQAHGGTLLIDEIGDLDVALQPKLLRALERSEIKRVGGERSIPIDVRIISATRRDLDREVQAGRFRDDLFHRLAIARIALPPLRSRREDVRPLAAAFCRSMGAIETAIPESLLAQWEDYAWPGNVRELRNAVARHLAIGDVLDRPFSAPIDGPGRSPFAAGFLESILQEQLSFFAAKERVVGEFERRYVSEVLSRHGGNVVRAAEASGLARRQFQRIKARIPK